MKVVFVLSLAGDRARWHADTPENLTPTAEVRPAFDITGKPCYLTRLERTVFCHFCGEPINRGVWHRWLRTAFVPQPFCTACSPVEWAQVSIWGQANEG